MSKKNFWQVITFLMIAFISIWIPNEYIKLMGSGVVGAVIIALIINYDSYTSNKKKDFVHED